ncbi:MAG: hypothetical protein LBI20_02840 [Holosporales bacterium]|jgi:hypothetical protein|nr:hypothetical protein [Holosporales bacterium]
MNQLTFAKLTAAKICHELANHMSAVQFVCEDLLSSAVEIRELLLNVQLLSLTLRFFRGMYAVNGHAESLVDILFEIANIKKLIISDEGSVLSDSVRNPDREKLLCGAVYLVSKSCRQNDEIIITDDKSNVVAEITVKNKGRMLPSGIVNALQHDIPGDSVNIFAIYIKRLANFDGNCINIDTGGDYPLKLKIWKK